jgi:hypothetical protein
MVDYQDVRYVTRPGRYKGVRFEVVLIIGGDHGVQIDRVSADGFPQIRYYQGVDFPTSDQAFAAAEQLAANVIDS